MFSRPAMLSCRVFLRKCHTVVVFLAQIDQLHLDAEQQRVTMNKLLAEAEDRERRLKEASSEEVPCFGSMCTYVRTSSDMIFYILLQLSTLRTSHQREMQRVYAESAMHFSNSKLAELSSKVDTQDVSDLYILRFVKLVVK